MMNPKINKWYQDAETMEIFEVIDINEDFVDIQFASGSITEYALDDWYQLHLLPAAQPADWSMAWDLSDEDKGQAYENDEDEEHHHKTTSIEGDDLESLGEDLEGYEEVDDL